MKFVIFITLCGCITWVSAQTTSNHTHHEKPEMDFYNFHFDPITHLMLVYKDANCYIWQLTDAERAAIHTDAGIRNVEMRVLSEIDDALYTVVPKVILHPTVVRSCTTYAHHYYLVH